MTHEASPESPLHPESPASPKWDNCSASDSNSFSDSDSDASDADSEGIAEEWAATLPVGDKANPHTAVLPEDQDAFFREVLGEGYLKIFDSADAIFIACLQAMYRTSRDSQETQRQDIKLLQKQLDCKRLAKENLSRELQIVESKLDLIESMRSDVKLLQNGFEQSLHKLQAAQQDIETGKFERAKLSQDLRATQDEIITAEEELGEKEEQVVTIQNHLVDVEIAHNDLEKSVETKFRFFQEILDSMQANLQTKEGFLTERNKLRSEIDALQSQVVAMHNGIQSREQNDNKRNAAIHCRVDDQEQQIARLERDGRHHFKAYRALKNFTDMVAGKLPQIENLRMVVDAHNESIQSQERTSVKIFKTLQTRIDDHDQVLRRIQKKFTSYATTDSVGRVSNLLATRIDDCTIEIGQNCQWLRDGFGSQIASIDTALKEVTTKFGFFSIASVPNLHERIDAAKEYIDFVDGRVKAVGQRVDLDSHRIVHVGQHVSVVERQIGEIYTQNAELQEENTKLRCIVEQQGGTLRQISSHIMPGEDSPSVVSNQTDFIEGSSSLVLTGLDTSAPFLDFPWNMAEADQKPSGDLFNGRVVKPEGYQDLLDRVPDSIRLIFNLADAAVDPRLAINSLSAYDEIIWAGISREYRRLVGLVCLKYMASDAKLSDDGKHLRWIAETLSAEDWANYEYFLHQQLRKTLSGQAQDLGQTAWRKEMPFAFKCYKSTDNKGHEPLAKTEYKLSKDVMEGLKTWLDAARTWPELSGREKKPVGNEKAAIDGLGEEGSILGEVSETQAQRGLQAREQSVARTYLDDIPIPTNNESFIILDDVSALRSDRSLSSFRFGSGPSAIEAKEPEKEESIGRFAKHFHGRIRFGRSEDKEFDRGDTGERNSDTVVCSPGEGEEISNNKENRPFEELEGHG